jgi:hypothetical protein
MESTLAAIAFAALMIAQVAAVVAMQAHSHTDSFPPLSVCRNYLNRLANLFRDLPKRRRVMFNKKESGRKVTVVIAGMSLLAAGAFVWSRSARSAGPDLAPEVRATTASAISPMDLMFKGGRLPTENWDPL